MTTPAPSGGSSPLRVGGFALLGVGIVAGIIGLASLFLSGDDGDQAAAPSPSTTASTTPSAGAPPSVGAAPTGGATPGGTPPGDGSVPLPSFSPAPPAGAASGGDAGGGDRVAAPRAPLRVYNNSTITGLAASAAADFRSAGWTVEEVGNYPSGTIPTSTVYYRPGTGEQAAAEALGEGFGLRVKLRFEGLDEASPGLIVIVTNDYQRR